MLTWQNRYQNGDLALRHIFIFCVYLSGREVSQSPSIAVVFILTDTLRSVVNCA